MIIALSLTAMSTIKEQLTDFNNNRRPMSLQLLLNSLAVDGAVIANPLKTPKQAIAISWQIDAYLPFWHLLGKKYYMIIWGLPRRGIYKDCLVRYLLRHASGVFVNDRTSEQEVQKFAEVKAIIFPYLVDTQYYSFVSSAERKNFVFCPGTNDRNGEMLVQLANSGLSVIWLNNDPIKARHYSSESEKLKIVSNPSFNSLRKLYCTCRACILPLSADIHAAGQTSSLEAMACGAPVFISQGRTSGIFEPNRLVTTVKENNVGAWLSALNNLPSDDELLKRSNYVEKMHSPVRVSEVLVNLLTGAA